MHVRHMLPRLWGLLMIGLIGLPSLVGQDLPFRKFTTEDGLSNNRVLSLLQDQFGFIWIGTRDGLNRYDGYGFKVFNHIPGQPNSISHNGVSALYEDGEGKIWIGTGNGLDVYDPHTDQITPFMLEDPTFRPTEPDPLRVLDIKEDENHTLWIGTLGGIWRIDSNRNNHQFLPLTIPNATNPSMTGEHAVREILLTPEGYLLAATDVGVMTLSNDRQSLVLAEDFLPLEKVRALYKDSLGAWWVGTWDKGLYFQTGRGEPWQSVAETFETNIPLHSSIRSIHHSSQFPLLVGTGNGLAHLKVKEQKLYVQQPNEATIFGLSHPGVRVILEDRQQNLWVGTWRGLNVYSKSLANFELFRKSPGQPLTLKDNSVSAFAEDQAGGIWIGTENGGVHYKATGQSHIESVAYEAYPANPVAAADIKALCLDQQGKLWIGTHEYGLIKLDPTTKTSVRFVHDPKDSASLSGNQVYVLHRDKQGKIWIGTNKHGLNAIDPITHQITRYCFQSSPNCLNHFSVKSILEDYLGNIWVGTSAGLNLLDQHTHTFTSFDLRPEPHQGIAANPMIRCLFEDRQKRLWVGTGIGLFQFDRLKGIFKVFDIRGITSPVINGIREDDLGRLWLTTNNGILRVEVGTGMCQTFNQFDGLQGRQFNQNAILYTKEGNMLVGGVNGMNVFNPEEVVLTSQPMDVHITDFWLLNKQIFPQDSDSILAQSVMLGPPLALSHRQNTFSFQFLGIHYSETPFIRYAYQIEGLDPAWIETGTDRKITLTGLPPGNYLFRVRAAARDGIWHESSTPIPINIARPFWQTPWAILGYILITLGLIAIGYGVIIRMTRLRHRLNIERLKQENQEELHQAKLRFFTNISHEFRTPLTLMLGPLEDMLEQWQSMPALHKGLKRIKNQADSLLNLTNQLLLFRKLETKHINMSAQKGDLVEYIRSILQGFEAYGLKQDLSLTFLPATPNLLVWFDPFLLERVLLNLLSNAFKYSPPGGEVVLTVKTVDPSPEYKEGHVQVSVIDQGPGIKSENLDHVFDRYFQTDNRPETGEGTGIGLSLTREIIQLHHGRISVSSVPFEETCFSFVLPLGCQHLTETERQDLPLSFEPTESLPSFSPLPAHTQWEKEGSKVVPTGYTLLIVEDNEEIAAYLQESLQDEYDILTASNGESGLHQALEHFPDLIISDVMMPVMSGIELCQEIRKDIRISHIPIILLTARDSIIHEVEALEIGADEYIRKPFHPKVLKARVKNLIDIRSQLQQRFELDIPLKPQATAWRKQEDSFLEKVMAIISDNLEDQNFNVEKLGIELGMSRASLFQKLKALTGLAPSDMIRNYKLKKAAELLLGENLTVSEVAYKVGFNSPSHFSSAFKRYFGEPPSKYLARMQSSKLEDLTQSDDREQRSIRKM